MGIIVKEKKKAKQQAEKAFIKTDITIGEKALELVKSLKDSKVPTNPEEREQFFMTQVSSGETLASKGPSEYDNAAKCFYQALKVYPNPVELIMIYQKTVPEQIFALVMSMMTQEVNLKKLRYFEVFPPSSMNVSALPNTQSQTSQSSPEESIEKKSSKKDRKSKKKGTASQTSVESNKNDIDVPRSLHSTKDFKTGETIFTEEPIISSLFFEHSSDHFCHNCSREIPNSQQPPVENPAQTVPSISIITPEVTETIEISKDISETDSDIQSSTNSSEITEITESQISAIEAEISIEDISLPVQESAVLEDFEASSDDIKSVQKEAEESVTESITAEPTEPITAEPTEPITAEPTESITAEPTEPITAEPTEVSPESSNENTKEEVSENDNVETETPSQDEKAIPKETTESPIVEEKKDDLEQKIQKESSEVTKEDTAFKCEKCGVAVYCSKSCQNDAWEAEHQFLCTAESNTGAIKLRDYCKDQKTLSPDLITKLFGEIIDVEKRKDMAAALGIPKDKQPKTKVSYLNNISSSEEFTVWEHMERLPNQTTINISDDKSSLVLLNEVLGSKVPGLSDFVTEERYSIVKNKLDRNCFYIKTNSPAALANAESEKSCADTYHDNKNGVSIGTGLYFVASYLENSNEPNVEIQFNSGDNKMSLVAIKDINKGDKLFADYN
ncbi:hypothetical protein BB559_004519 [Furculomyces boomerangus]|uniref:Mitochondrial import receptor subunit TOM20 n=1 Tax=Furculomyces boomerangus TaxID=61424 RepID=A0A2T9YE44_9FUNG|nr:hypothetical protein BB559_004519 [Furculomyces boomerangus]